MMDAKQLFDSGELSSAIDTLSQELRSHPVDAARRYFYAELLCFLAEWERCDKQLDIIGHQNPEMIPGVSLFRQLLRAGQVRQQFFLTGRVPEFIDSPPTHIQNHLKAAILLRESNSREATDILTQASEMRGPLAGTIDGDSFSDIRDLDDLTSTFLEVFAGNGKYYWFPFESVTSVEFEKPKRPRDLLWRKCRIELQNERGTGLFFMPVVYPTVDKSLNEQTLLGRSTEWIGEKNTPVRGIGQRMFLIDESTVGIMEMEKLTITLENDA